MESIAKTKKSYGFLWTISKEMSPQEHWHFDAMQEVVSEPIVRGTMGIDVGSGCGYDTYIIAKNYPSVSIISLDLSDGVYSCKKLTSDLKNVKIIESSILDVAIKPGIFDFAYCYGVLHHIHDPARGLSEIGRILKKDAPVFLYLYEDHSENFVKYSALKAVNILRRITVRIPPRLLYMISILLSPFVAILFSYPAKFLRRFKSTRAFADKMPFNFGTHLFSLAGDIYDRFSAPIEFRFNKDQVFELLEKAGFLNITIKRFSSVAGWVAWGYKK